MHQKLAYNKLLEKYSDLQLRVTRFSTVEQELINTRDQLDHELIMYKRLSKFNVESFNCKSHLDFLKLVNEAIIDLFEIECSVVYFQLKNKDFRSTFFIEGFNVVEEKKAEFENQITQLFSNHELNTTYKISKSDLGQLSIFEQFNEGITFSLSNNDNEYIIRLIGLNSIKNAPFYGIIEKRVETIFEVFAQQVKSHIENRLKEEKIKDQLLDISKSRIELKKLSLIATRTKNSVIISDQHGKIEWVNKAFEEITGYEKNEVLGKKPKEFLQGPASDPELINKISQSLERKENIELTLVNYKKNKEPYYNQLEITPIFDENNELINFISLQRDITEETKSKLEILKINSRFELIADKSNIGIWEWDAINQSIIWNDVLIKMYGVRRSDVEPVLLDFWKSSIHPDDRERIITEVNQLIEDKSNDILEQEYRIIRLNDFEERFLKCHTLIERNKEGNMLRLIGTAIDITEIKQFENDILTKNEELNKINAELDNFVYSVSHDLRSPLLSIKGILSLVFNAGNLTEETINYLKLAESSVTRLDGTIQEILEYSRNARLELSLQTFNLETIVRQIYDDLKFSTNDIIDFICDLDCSPIIHSDKSRIEILLKNLIGNAFKYKRKDITNPFVHFRMRKDSDNLYLTIEDNGEGIEEKHLDKIFDMFYRASSASQGTGLGLYICKEITTKLNGTIEITSEPKKGTSVCINLPIKDL